MRRLLPVALALIGALSALPAEDTAGATPTPSATTASTEPDLSGISTTTSKHANVRFGPNTKARIACTLNTGDPIEIVGPAPVPDWYVIHFPQKGMVWVSDKHLVAVDGGKRWKVTVDGVNARDDATLKGNIVAELTVGEILEDRNAIRGSWHAVYIPSAIAYIHKSVINIPDAASIQQQQANASKIDALWQSAQQTYTQIYKQISANPSAAVGIDWTQLLADLQQVAQSHPDPAIRQAASRIHDGIELVAAKSKAVQDTGGVNSPTPTPAPTTPTVAAGTGGGATAPATGGTAGATTPADGPMHHIDIDAPQPLVTPPQADPGVVVVQPTTSAPPDAPTSYDAVGCVTENTDYPKVNAPDVLLDPNSNPVAFLVPKAGSTINLGEYIWRWVGVKGEVKDLDPALHGIGRKVPLIEVDTIHLVKN